VTRHSHQIFDSKGAARRLVDWVSGAAPDRTGPGTSIPEIVPEIVDKIVPEFPGLIVDKIGDRIVVKAPGENVGEKLEWTAADFAHAFLDWMLAEYPVCAGGWVTSFDIETKFFPRWRAAAGCIHLDAGSLLRGLSDIVSKREHRFTDRTGKRRGATAYRMPRHSG
jgi:hypothetical protein